MLPQKEKKEIISLDVMEDMQNIWSVFDLENKDQVATYELRTILRALDIDPSEEELDMLTKQVDPDQIGFFNFEKLNAIMEEKLKDIDTKEDLLAELQKLDKDLDGKIPTPQFK